jgi:hypothetical protein
MKDYKKNTADSNCLEFGYSWRPCSIAAYLVLLVVVVFSEVCMGQQAKILRNMISEKESFQRLTDTLIKREIAVFNFKGSANAKIGSLSETKLKSIPVRKCLDDYAYFSKGSIIVSIESDSGIPKSRVKEIMFIYVKDVLILPDSAIANIYELNFCSKSKSGGKKVTTDCKVFLSEDRRRGYIYMLNGSDKDQYEVTWIIQDSKYYGRVVDFVPAL